MGLRSRAMPCSRPQIDVVRGASHAGRRWIWHPEQVWSCSMPRPPLSARSTALTDRHACSPNITLRSAANCCQLLPAPVAPAPAPAPAAAPSPLHSRTCVSTTSSVCEFGTVLPAVHSIRDGQSFQHRTLTPVHACSLGIRATAL